MPVLAICRGLQLLNVARGGTLHQHLPEALGTERYRVGGGVFATNTVEVDDGHARSPRSSATASSTCTATTTRASTGSATGSS